MNPSPSEDQNKMGKSYFSCLCVGLHLDSWSKPESSGRAFPGPWSLLGSREEEEDEEEEGHRGPCFPSLSLLTSWQVIDGYLLSLTKSSFSTTKTMYSRVRQTLNYTLRSSQYSTLTRLSLPFTLSLPHSAEHDGRQTKQNKKYAFCPSCEPFSAAAWQLL